jgi:hypothetical protein
MYFLYSNTVSLLLLCLGLRLLAADNGQIDSRNLSALVQTPSHALATLLGTISQPYCIALDNLVLDREGLLAQKTAEVLRLRATPDPPTEGQESSAGERK